MVKRQSKIFILIAIIILFFSLGVSVYADEEVSYYVCFSTDNYSVKNTNKMTLIDTDGDSVLDTYVLKNKSLSSSTEFYVVSNKEEKFYSADGSNMKVNENSSYRYNIYFLVDGVFDEERVNGTDIELTNSHVSYAHYIPGNYTLSVDGVINSGFQYSPYVTSYDAYILPEVVLGQGSSLVVTNLDNSDTFEYSVENSGNYRVVFTPTVNKNGNNYCFNSDGEYGYGDEYNSNFYVSDVEYYYISFDEDITTKNSSSEFSVDDNTINGYRLVKDETVPNANVFKASDFFNPKKNHTIEYHIYKYNYIFSKYEEIKLEDDKKREEKLSDVSWYKITLTVAENNYSVAYTKEDTDFGGYYIVGEFNNYGFNTDGTLNLEEKYQLILVGEDSSYYIEDKKQFILADYKIYKNMLDEDDDIYEFKITNGKDSTNTITIKTPGTYDILYSSEENYNGSSYKYVRVVDSDEVFTTVEIDSMKKLFECIDQWNIDSESSKYVIYNLTCDIDFTGVDVPSVAVFNGTLHGNGHVISNLTIKEDNAKNEIGLFKLVTKYGSIDNLKIVNLTIDADDSNYVGFISKNYGYISNIKITGSVKGARYVGALVGYNGNYQQDSDTSSDSTIKYGYGLLENIVNECDVLGNVIVGGIAGFNGGKILSSSNVGRINNKKYSSSVTIMNIGGICGYSTGEIVDVENNGKIGYAAIGSNIGGITGLGNGEIYYSKNNGSVYGKTNVGGIVGYFGTVSSESDDSSNMIIAASGANQFVNQNNKEPEFDEETDVSKHLIVYSIDYGNVHATTYAGGIVGYNNSTTLSIKNTISKGEIYADSGSYAAGIVGYMASGNITSCAFYGSAEANGSVNKYVGGIVGYLGGTIEGCYSNAILTGNEYVGGIAGYGTDSANIISNISTSYLITKSTHNYVGNIAGFVDGKDDSSATYGDRVKYNYYLGSDLEDYSGINNVNYGKASHFAASRVYFKDVTNAKFLSTVSHRFGLIDEEDETYYFESVDSTNLPYLTNFITIDEIEDDDFDDATDVYLAYQEYFDKYKDEYKTIMDSITELSIRIVFKEWDSEIDDNEYDNYNVVNVMTVKYGTNFSSLDLPAFKYVDEDNKTSRSDALYVVSWGNITNEFSNKTVYAVYTETLTNIDFSNSNIKGFIEGEFEVGTTIDVEEASNGYKLIAKKNGNEIVLYDVKVKVYQEDPKRTVFTVNGEKGNYRIYGKYVEFSLSSTNDVFNVERGPYTFSMLPDYVVALIFVVPFLLIIVLLVVRYNIKDSKRIKEEQNKEEATADSNKQE